ncbi:DUF2079 domain-containing protein [Terrarubrum flagellatum]|uniref:DUF2079 domain-containing protein n=1 Tax=Terrirubrum flagellatum TaxID=2895980 RepID=UPI0031451E60
MRNRQTIIRVIVGGAGVAAILMPILRYWALNSSYYDLGQYATNYAIAAIDGLWGISFRSHAHPVMLIFSPFVRAAPFVETLLLEQSLLLLAGVYAFGCLWRNLGAGAPEVGALLAICSLAFWSAAIFDYHFEHLLLLAYVIFFLRLECAGKFVDFELFAIAMVIAAIKESLALTSAGLGIYLILANRRPIAGTAILVGASVYFVAVTSAIIPFFSDGRQSGDLWREAFSYLGDTPRAMIYNIVFHPSLLAEAKILTPRKLVYLSAIFLPFLPALLRAPLLALPALPHVAIALLSRNANHTYLAHHYTIPVLVPFLVVAAYAIAGRRDWLILSFQSSESADSGAHSFAARTAFIGSYITLVLFGLSPVSRLFFSPSASSYNFAAYIPSERSARLRALIATHTPTDRRIVVSMQNNVHDGRLSLRTNALAFPDGVFEPVHVICQPPSESGVTLSDSNCSQPHKQGAVLADFVVLDLKRPWFVNDQLIAATDPESDRARAKFEALVTRLQTDFTLVVENDGFQIWRRRSH